MTQNRQFSDNSLEDLVQGIKKLTKAVKGTLAPYPRAVLLQTSSNTFYFTKNAKTIAKALVLPNKFENLAVQIIREAICQEEEIIEDAAAMTIILIEAILTEGIKHVVTGIDPLKIKKEIQKAINTILPFLESIPQKKINKQKVLQIIHQRSQDEETENILLQAIEKIGEKGFIHVQESPFPYSYVEIVEGLQIDKGYASTYFVTDPEKMDIKWQRTKILVTQERISSVTTLASVLAKVMRKNKEPLLLIAKDFSEEVLTTLILNKIQANFPICAIKAPLLGEKQNDFLQDIAIATNAICLSTEKGKTLEDFEEKFLGIAASVAITKNSTTLFTKNHKTKHINARIQQLQDQLTKETSYDKIKWLKQRIYQLQEKMAVIHVAGKTKIERQDKIDYIGNILNIIKAAKNKKDMITGIRSTFLQVSNILERMQIEEVLGKNIMQKVLLSTVNFPLFKEEDTFVDDIVIPTYILRKILRCASSVASMMLSSGFLMAEAKDLAN